MFWRWRYSRFEYTSKIEGVLFVLIGLYMFVLAFDAGLDIAHFNRMEKNCTRTVKATVTSVDRQSFSRYVTKYVYTADGQELYGSATLKEGEQLSKGDDIIVNYDPSNPNMRYTRYDSPGFGGLVGRILAGLACIAYGIYTVRKLDQAGVSWFEKARL